MMTSWTARERLFPVMTPEDCPIVLPAAFVPSRRQLPVGQLNDHDWANTSKNNKVQRARNMRKRAFFMSCIWTSYQISCSISKNTQTFYSLKCLDNLPFTTRTTSTESSSSKSAPTTTRTPTSKSPTSASPTTAVWTAIECFYDSF